MTFRTFGSYASSVNYCVKRPGKEQPILHTLSFPGIAEYEFFVLLNTPWGEITLPRNMSGRTIALTPLAAARELQWLDRKTRDSVRVPVNVTPHGNEVVSADLTIISSDQASGASNERTETLFFLERYLDSSDGVLSVPYWVLQRALHAQFARREHNLDPVCPLRSDPGMVLRPRGKWGGTVHLARLVLEHFSAEDMGESNYESVRSLVQATATLIK